MNDAEGSRTLPVDLLSMRVNFAADLELGQQGHASYLFVNVPEDASDELEDLSVQRGGFASIKVDATIGSSTWRTSVFPSKDGFILLVSRKLAEAESLDVGEPVQVTLRPLMSVEDNVDD